MTVTRNKSMESQKVDMKLLSYLTKFFSELLP